MDDVKEFSLLCGQQLSGVVLVLCSNDKHAKKTKQITNKKSQSKENLRNVNSKEVMSLSVSPHCHQHNNLGYGQFGKDEERGGGTGLRDGVEGGGVIVGVKEEQ